jgi:hypothetical protein
MSSQAVQRSQDTALSAAVPFRAWIERVKPGGRIEYHHDFLAADRSPTSYRVEHERPAWTKLAGRVLKKAEAHQVHLVQHRSGPAGFSYLAIKAAADAQSAITVYRP